MNHKIYIIIALLFVLASCQKEYDIKGERDTVEDYDPVYNNDDEEPEVVDCYLDTMILSNYINQSYVSIRDFEISDEGVIWVATSAGLLMVDGENYFVYNTQNTIFEDNYMKSVTINDNYIWVSAIYGGLYRLDVNTSQWTNYDETNSFVYSAVGKVLVDDNSNVYVVDYGYLYQFENNEWNTLLNPDDIRVENTSMNLDYPNLVKYNDEFWIATRTGLMRYVDANDWSFYSTTNSNLSDNNISNLSIDNLGRKWMETDSGVEMFDNTNWHLFSDRGDVAVVGDLVFSNPKSTINICTYNNGVWEEYFECNQGQWFFYDIEQGEDGYVYMAANSVILKLNK